MKNILEFKRVLKQDRENRVLNRKLEEFGHAFEFWEFHLTTTIYNPNEINIKQPHLTLIDLDEEDIEYFKKKYLTKENLQKEMDVEIDGIKSKYK